MTLHTLDYWQSQAAALRPEGRAYIDSAYADAADGATFRPAARSTAASWPTWPPAARPMSTAPWPPPAAPSRPAPGRRWRRASKAALLRLAALIEAHKEELALLETLDMGKPIRDALQFDLPETIQTYSWYGEAVDKRYDEIAPTGANALATITREPVGVVAAVVPWNYPC